jgi:hypothetical protein
MKKIKYIFGLMVAVAFSSTAFGQTTVADGDPGETDSIAVNSIALYKVDLDIVANTLYNNSGVIWAVPSPYTVAANLKQSDGSTALTSVTADGAYDQNIITFLAPSAATGSFALTAQEKSRPKAGTGCISATTTTKNIVVVNLPTATYGADSGSCALPTSLNVPVNFTGYGKYDVVFSVQAYNMSGTAVGSTVSRTQADLVSSRTSETTKLHYVTLLTDATGGTVFTDISTTGGYYEISITDLQDRISKKTLSYNWTSHSNEVANTNPDGALVYKFYVYPAPTTQPIQHVKNY